MPHDVTKGQHLRVGFFSAGATSAVACILEQPDLVLYADTRSEDEDNARFRTDVAEHLEAGITVVGSEKYASTWDVWERKQSLGSFTGAPCTVELKRKPLDAACPKGATRIYGFTVGERVRHNRLADALHPEPIRSPLIERGLTKDDARGMLASWGIEEPRLYRLGYTHANCIPCCKAESASYWAAIRRDFPEEFARYVEMSDRPRKRVAGTWRRVQVQYKGERIPLRELPADVEPKPGQNPDCGLLCLAAMSHHAA